MDVLLGYIALSCETGYSAHGKALERGWMSMYR